MKTIDRTVAGAPAETCFRAAADVERWPDFLPHYRSVSFRRQEGFGRGIVEMAARRDFGPVPYPVWWVSEMRIDEAQPAVLYRHIEGITTGMDVVWSFERRDDGSTLIEIVHEWETGPAWPLPGFLRRSIADAIIGPIFIHHVASRTLAGVRERAVRIHQESRGNPS